MVEKNDFTVFRKYEGDRKFYDYDFDMIKDELLHPFIELNTEYYDLGLKHRNDTNDQVTVDSANATMKYGVAVKCATITPNAARMDEYN